MFIRFTAALAAGLLLGTAQASQIGDQLTVHCTGSLRVSGIDGVSMTCEGGDLALYGLDGGLGTLNSNIGIDLFATGGLDLERVTLRAPTIRLTGHDIKFGLQTALHAETSVYIDATANPTVQSSPQDISQGDQFDVRGAGSATLTSAGGSSHLTQNGATLPQGALLITDTLRYSGGNIVLHGSDIPLLNIDPSFLSSLTISPVPEPGALALYGMGLLAIMTTRRRRRR